MDEIFLFIDGQTVGPYEINTVCKRISAGELSPSTLYFNPFNELKPLYDLPRVQVAFRQLQAESTVSVIVRAFALLAGIGFGGVGFLQFAAAKSAMHETTAGVYLVGGVLICLLAVTMPKAKK